MKKRLEAELISIAHRILKLKNKSELEQLHHEAQKLYETLSVLKFVEKNFDDAKPTIGRAQVEAQLEADFDAETDERQNLIEAEIPEPDITPKPKKSGKTKEINFLTEQPEAQIPEHEETPQESHETEQTPEIEIPEEAAIEIESESTEYSENEAQESEISSAEESNITIPGTQPEASPMAAEVEAMPEISNGTEESIAPDVRESDDSFFKPAFELAFDNKEPENIVPIEDKPSEEIVFEEFLGRDYVDPVFVKPEEMHNEIETEKAPVIPIGRNFSDATQVIPLKHDTETQTQTLNDRIAKGITIGLNDRIAFMKHLFNNSSEDYNRVLSQLITFDTLSEATNFIDNMVKPDYNNWEGKDEYSQRFMEIIEKRFS